MPSSNGADPKRGLEELVGTSKDVIGMVHLLPLPGSPKWAGQMAKVLERAVADARALEGGGVDGRRGENFGAAAFRKGRVEAHTVSAMTLAVMAVREAVGIPVGLNVLRNDIRSAIAIASVTDGQFVRANVHTGAMLTDQGIIEGDAYETIRYREQMSADIKIFADVLVKHGTPLGDQSIEQAARDTAYRGLADAIIVTGSGTGQPADMEDLMRAKEAVPDVPVLVGSGVHESNVVKVLSVADGVIVGTSLKEGGIAAKPVDQARVAALIATVKGLR